MSINPTNLSVITQCTCIIHTCTYLLRILTHTPAFIRSCIQPYIRPTQYDSRPTYIPAVINMRIHSYVKYTDTCRLIRIIIIFICGYYRFCVKHNYIYIIFLIHNISSFTFNIKFCNFLNYYGDFMNFNKL